MLPIMLENSSGMKKALPVLAVLAAFFLGFWLLKNTSVATNKNKTSQANLTSTITSKYAHYPVPGPLHIGNETYLVSSGAGSVGPNIQSVILEPLDPKKGEVQIIKVKVGSNDTMKTVSVTVNTDYDVKTYNASLKEGTKINGIWEVLVTSSDTHDYIYRVRVDASDSKDESSVTVAVR